MEQPPSTKAEDMLAEEIQGVDYPSMYHVYKPKRGIKRGEESKDTYKLPHRLIEKKRRDRINECISQLKDLLPEHLKLTTLGHLEKAVVLELTLKHVNGLTSLLEQQQQKILALQSGMPVDPAPDVRGQTEETFRSGFHLCAKEVLSYLSANPQSGGGGGDHLSPPRLVSHIQTLAAEVLQGGTAPARDRLRTPSPSPPPRAEEEEEEAPPARSNHHHHHHIHHHHHRDKPVPLSPDHAPRAEGYGRNCVPVIRRAFGGGGQWGPAGASGGSEQSGSDTDTDSGYGGEQASLATTANQQQDTLPLDHAHHYYYGDEQLATKRRSSSHFKQDGGNKRPRHTTMSSEEDDSLSGGESSSSSSSSSSLQTRPYMGVGRHPPTAPPLCAVPFYLLPPQAAAAYLPMLEKEAAAWYQPHPPRGAVLYPAAMGGVPPASSPPALLQALQQHHRQSTPPAIDLEAKD